MVNHTGGSGLRVNSEGVGVGLLRIQSLYFRIAQLQEEAFKVHQTHIFNKQTRQQTKEAHPTRDHHQLRCQLIPKPYSRLFNSPFNQRKFFF